MDTKTGAVEVRHNGDVRARYDSGDSAKDQNDAWMYILKHQPHSVDYAMRHAGWEIATASPDEDEAESREPLER